MSLVPVILCGGSGSRLWPLSRAMYPKQLLALAGDGDRSLLQETAARIAALEPQPEPPLVVCNEAHRFLVSGQLEALGVEPTIILEPEGRNTAPAAAVAALLQASDHDESALLLVLPADHVIQDTAALRAAVSRRDSGSEAGPARYIRHRADGAGDRLRLYPRGRGRTGCDKGGRAICRKTRCRDRASLRAVRLRTTGTAACFCSRRRLISRNLRAQAPDMIAACREAVAARDAGVTSSCAWIPTRSCSLSGRLDRLRGHGKNGRCERRAARCGLERCGFLGGVARGDVSQDEDGNTLEDRRCRRRGLSWFLPARREPPRRRPWVWTAVSSSRRKMRCSSRRQEPGSGGEEDRR